jgi:CO/xanthine dehydrogenase Mo-binding subunit
MEAMQTDAPLLHDDIAAYVGAPTEFLAPDIHNGQTRLYWTKGDLDKGFAEADVVLEHSFSIPSRHQGYIEPFTSVIDIDDDGRIQAWCSSKAPFRARRQMAEALGLNEETIRVNVTSIGGDFGGKGDTRDLPIAYLLAKMADRPVKIVMSSVEELTSSNPTHPTFVTIKSGIKRDGQITAREVRTVHNSGAYGALKPRAYLSTHHYVGGAYRIPNATFEFLQVYTNTVPGGYFRAPGAHQYTFALECHTDLLARELGMDPAVFRRVNILLAGEEDGLGRPIDFLQIREVMDAALDAAGWDKPENRPGHGRGVALFGRQIGGGVAGAVLTAEADGSFSVISPTVDIGTGTHTIEKQMVASEMGVSIDRVSVRVGDTDSVPYDEGPRASRVTYTEGQAVMKACAQIKQAIADGVTLPFTVTVEHTAEERDDITYFGAQVAEVHVDSETGLVKVLRIVTAHDVGTIIHPLAHQGQIDGGVITGFGLGVTEEFVTGEQHQVDARRQ